MTANHWYRIQWNRSGSGTGLLTVKDLTGGTTQTATLSGLTTTGAWRSLCRVIPRAASTRSLDFDWFAVTYLGMARS